MKNDIYINGQQILSENDIPVRNVIETLKIKCVVCLSYKTLKIFRKDFLNKEYKCQSCVKTGINNSFYGKHHSNESKKMIGACVCNYIGKNNPFYGKKHDKNTIEKIKNKCREKSLGCNNPFYGKHHSNESKKIIIEKNKDYREKNKEKIINDRLKLWNKTKEDFKCMLEDYINNTNNRLSIQEKYGFDYRTLDSYWIKLKLISKEDLKMVKLYKKLFSNPSKPEMDLYNLLKEKYGDNVKHCYELKKYYYDICLFNKILIEYDGYYWHKILKNKNDEIKNSIAKECGYILYRVEEEKNRKTDFIKELNNINSLLKQQNIIQ